MAGTARGQDWLIVILGGWLFFSPFIFDYTQLQAAAWNSYVLGVVIAVFAVWAVFVTSAWLQWVSFIFGFWVFVSPLVLGYRDQPAPTWNQVGVGVLIILISLWAVYRPIHREVHAPAASPPTR